MAVFVDASVFCAYANLDDIHHKKAKNIIEKIAAGKYGKAVTTDYIFDETVTVVLRKTNKKNALEVGNVILNSELLIAQIDSLLFQKAWRIFQKKDDFSFTDCTILAFMKVFGIRKIATFDKAFKKIKEIEVVD